MAEPEVVIDVSENNTPAPTQSQDVDMGGQDESTQPEGSAAPSTEQQDEPTGLENIEDIQPEIPARVTFLDYLKSPIVELSVGTGEDITILHAHQLQLEKSPYLEEKISALAEGENRRIDLPDEDLLATACFLEFLYKADYFPTLSGSSLESSQSSLMLNETFTSSSVLTGSAEISLNVIIKSLVLQNIYMQYE
ncbi:hypothetical protein VTO58DRAFT_105812 [Aureobasidium pullulans]|nr:hypothetical protein JADG_002423 [Aureobasidium pullulans]